MSPLALVTRGFIDTSVRRTITGLVPSDNCELSNLAGINDQGQVSKLLARLKGLGLLQNTAGPDARAKGAPNAWSLTDLGEQVVQHLSLDSDSDDRGSAA